MTCGTVHVEFRGRLRKSDQLNMATGRDENSNLSDEELTKLLQFQVCNSL